MAYSFNTQGATPLSANVFASSGVSGSTPQANALNTIASGQPRTNAVMLPPPFASTPLKSTTINNVDGSSITHSYHAPTPGILASAQVPTNQSVKQADGSYTLSAPPGSTAQTNGQIPAASQHSQTPQQPPVPSPATTAAAPQQPPQQPQTPLAQATTGLLGAGAANSAIAANANTIADKYANLANPGLLLAKGEELGNATTGTMPVGEGNASAIANATGTYMQGLSQQEQQQLAANAQGLTGQAQTQNALGTAGQLGSQTVTPPAGGVTTNLATGQQYSNPALAPIGSQQFYSPQPNGTAGQPPTAGQATPYTIAPGDTFSALAAKNGTTVAALEQANPGVNENNLQIGQSINIPPSQSGSPFTAGVVAGQQALGTQYAQNYSAYQQAEGIRNNIDSIVQSNPNLNPSQFTDVNSALQFLNGRVSNPQYAILANNVAEYVNTLAPILGVGGDTTNYKTELAQQFVTGAANGQNMQQILAGIAQTAGVKLGQQQSAGQSTGTVQQTQPTNSQTTSGGFSEGQTSSDGSLVYRNGQWTVK